MSSAPLDGTSVRLFAPAGSAIASYWSAERSHQEFGAGEYRAGWFLVDDDTIEVNDSTGWEPITYETDRTYSENKTGISDAGPVAALT